MIEEDKNLADEIQRSFLNLLKDNFPQDLLEKTKSNQTVKILSIGCGRFREAKSLFDYFHPHEENLRLFGIEINNEMFSLLVKDEFIKSKKDFICLKSADATNLSSYMDWIKDSKFDLIIFRHPEVTFNTNIVIKIFSMCPMLLSQKGYLLLTTHFHNEKEALIQLLKLYKFKILTDKENEKPSSFKKEGETMFADRFLLIASKTEPS